MRKVEIILGLLGLLALSSLAGAGAEYQPGLVYTAVVTDDKSSVVFRRGGNPFAELTRASDVTGATMTLKASNGSAAEITSTLSAPSYPRAVKVSARSGTGDVVEVDFVQMAPAMSIDAEGGSPGLGVHAEAFQKETGRKLRKYYEVSGRVVDGTLRVNGEKVAEFYTAYQREKNGSLKIHHRGDTLEHADIITYAGGRSFVSYRCGCHGYTEYNPKVTLGNYVYSLEVKSNGNDWVNINQGELFRKPRRYVIKDARGNSFGGIRIDYTGKTMHYAKYRFYEGEIELARAEVDGPNTRLELNAGVESAMERLDALLAMTPTQVIRGDGVRDSSLGQVETVQDWVRFVEEPTAAALADVVSNVDAATASLKARKMLEAYEPRFLSNRKPGEAPPGVVCTPDGCKRVPEAR